MTRVEPAGGRAMTVTVVAAAVVASLAGLLVSLRAAGSTGGPMLDAVLGAAVVAALTLTGAAVVALPDPPAVLVLTMVDDDGAVATALRAGARGYVLKGSTGQQIADAVRTVAGGGVVLGPGVATHLLTAPARLSTRTA